MSLKLFGLSNLKMTGSIANLEKYNKQQVEIMQRQQNKATAYYKHL